jgi:iron complex outermembrane receptor protein
MRTRLRRSSAIAALIMGAAGPVFAQTATPPSEDQGNEVSEIIVTAQKREERLQDVPIAISVVSGEAVEAQGGINIETAQYLIPTLNFRKAGTSLNQSLFLRGVGTINFSIAAEPSVATVLDGVVLSRSGEAFTDLVDIERLEVLRGPQGTLFGKNASAGVLNVVTRRPGDEFGGYLDAAYYEGNERRIRGAVDLPIAEGVAARITAFASAYDGNIYNAARTSRRRQRLRALGRARRADRRLERAALADADRRLPRGRRRLLRRADRHHPEQPDRRRPALVQLRRRRRRVVYQNLVTSSIEESGGVSLQADYDLGGAGVLTSITAYRIYDNREIRDGDFVDQAYNLITQLHDNGPQESDTFSQELRFTSPTEGRFDYVAGLFYSEAEAERTFTREDVACAGNPTFLINCANPFAPPTTFPSGSANFGSTFTNFAVFGQGTFDVTEDFRLIGGLRFTADELEVFHQRVTTLAGPGIQPSFPTPPAGTVVPAAPFTASTDETNLSGRFGAQYDFSPDVVGYATYSRGYKGPAYNIFFNLTATGTNVIEPETADSYEAGLKTTLLGGRVVLNAAAFYAKYENYQANNPDVVAGVLVTRLTNAGEVSTRGFEIDLIAQPIDNLSITGGFAFTQAEVDNFRAPPGATVIPAGTELANAPKYKMGLNADYRLVTGAAFDLGFNGSASYQSSQLSQFDANPVVRAQTTIEGYGLLDGAVSVIDADDRYRVTLQVRNILDTSFPASITTGGPGGSLRYIIPREADRYVGVQARVNF